MVGPEGRSCESTEESETSFIALINFGWNRYLDMVASFFVGFVDCHSCKVGNINTDLSMGNLDVNQNFFISDGSHDVLVYVGALDLVS